MFSIPLYREIILTPLYSYMNTTQWSRLLTVLFILQPIRDATPAIDPKAWNKASNFNFSC